MERMRSQKFEKAYKIVLADFKFIKNIGGYQNVGDYRDIVHDAYIYLSKKYTFNDESFALNEILSIFRKNIQWARLHKMRSLSDKANMYEKVYLSEIENFNDMDFMGQDFKSDDIGLSKFPAINLMLAGYSKKEMVDRGDFRTQRVAQYAFEKEKNEVKSLLATEKKRLEVVYDK